MTKAKRVGVYLRVSSDEQTTENQRRDLTAAAESHGWHVVETFADEGISGAKGRDKRPGLDKLLMGVARREFDLVAAWSVDRLGRSLQDLIGILGELHAKGVDLYLHRQGIDTTTPAGKAMFQMMGVFAEFERAMIRERIMSGLARARAQGKRIGRPAVSAATEAAVLAMRKEGKGMTAICKALHVGGGTVMRLCTKAQ